MSGDINRAECALLDRWLDEWTAGRVPDAFARRLEAHVAVCSRCACLVAVVRDDGPAASRVEGGEPDLLSGVLSRTTGSPCARAESLLPDLVDEEIDPASREMLEAHLAHCAPCSQLLEALRESERVMPSLVEIEPPPGFAEGVMRATTAALPGFARGARASSRVAAFGQWWQRVLARPRASLELAYAATVLLVILFGNPVAAFHQAEERAGRLAGAVPVSNLAGDVAVKKAAINTIDRLLSPFVAVANAVATELTERWRQARALLDQITGRAGDAMTWLATLDLRGIFGGLRAPSRGQPATGSHAPAASQPSGRK